MATRDEKGWFLPGASGNPSGKRRDGSAVRGATTHGFYRGRLRHCDACGAEYVARRLTSRFCSDDCRTNHGAWSYPVAHQTNKRALGTTKS